MIPFRPIVEPHHPGAFLIEDPEVALKTGRLADVPWMTGITSHEGSIKVPGKIFTVFDHHYTSFLHSQQKRL